MNELPATNKTLSSHGLRACERLFSFLLCDIKLGMPNEPKIRERNGEKKKTIPKHNNVSITT